MQKQLQPTAKKSKASLSAETGDLVEFLEKSQTKDHEFLSALPRERQNRN